MRYSLVSRAHSGFKYLWAEGLRHLNPEHQFINFLVHPIFSNHTLLINLYLCTDYFHMISLSNLVQKVKRTNSVGTVKIGSI